jgi:site-specific DNA recombinase
MKTTKKGKYYLGYIRVSNKEHDLSIPAQKKILEDYAARTGIVLVKVYAEKKSAFGKVNRKIFTEMVEHLKQEDVDGVVFHKVDRSARNMKDFTLLEGFFETKDLRVIEGEFDTSTSQGRFQFRTFCNMAIYYSENLSEEVTSKMKVAVGKGYFPAPTPIGYRRGIESKDEDIKGVYPDEALAPFVKQVFELFATGLYSTRSLCSHMRKQGMTNKSGNILKKGVFERMLKNPFYHGLIAWGRTRREASKIQYEEGKHKALIDKKLFDKVQEILSDRTQTNKTKHNHTYAKMIKCECGRFLVSGIHKGRVYLECQNKDCKFSSIREDHLEDQIIINLVKYRFDKAFCKYAKKAILKKSKQDREDNKKKRQALNLQLGRLDKELEKVKRAVLDGFFDAEEGLEEKNRIKIERHNLRQTVAEIEDMKEEALWKTTIETITIFNYIPYKYKELNPILKREFLDFLFLNRRLAGKKLLLEAVPAFDKLKAAQNLLKLILNHLPLGEFALEKALSANGEKAFLPVLPHGRGDRTRTCGLTVPNRVL